jgi:hypothetical protein
MISLDAKMYFDHGQNACDCHTHVRAADCFVVKANVIE